MKRHKQTEEEKQVTETRPGRRTPLVAASEDTAVDQPEPTPEKDAFNDMPNEFNEQPGSGSLMGGRRGEEEYGIKGPVVEDERHEQFRREPVQASDEEEIVSDEIIEAEPEPLGPLEDEFGGVSEYSSENAEQGEERIQQAEAASEKESEIKRGDPEVLANLTERLKERKALNLSQVNMQMKGGALTLSGQVEKVSEKTEIREVAEAIPGIHSVNDYLQVRPK